MQSITHPELLPDMSCRFISMNRPRSYFYLLAALTGCLLLTPARATSVIAPEFDSLVSQADYIVRAEVTDVTSEWQVNDTGRHIITKVSLNVKEVIAGTPPSPLILEFLGGEIDGVSMKVEGTPTFYKGDENILFVRGNGRIFCPLVAVMHGCYPVMRDTKTGESAMLRSNGTPLYNESEVSLPMATLSKGTLAKKTKRPLTAPEFASRIRLSRSQAHTANE